MTKIVILIVVVAVLGIGNLTYAQDSSKLSYATAIGLLKTTGSFNRIFQSAIAFSSEVEWVNSKKWFVDLTLDLSSLKYSQQVKDSTSPFLFQNTKSSLLMIGFNGGKKLNFKNKNYSISLYAGGGYLTVGEPRVNRMADTIIRQTVLRKRNVFGRLGSRIEYTTKIKILQGIYLNISCWASPAQLQGYRATGLSVLIGTRVSIL